MRIAIVAPMVRGAMGHYLTCWLPALAGHVHVNAFIPEHFQDSLPGLTVHRFPWGPTRVRTLARLLNPAGAAQLWGEVQGARPDVVHVFNGEGYPWIRSLVARARQARLPVVVTVHDPEVHPGNAWDRLTSVLRVPVLRTAHLLHVHSARFIPQLKRAGVPGDSIHVIPHGSVAPCFTRYRTGHEVREPVALFFGRLEAYKGLDVLAEAARLLQGRPRVLVAGPGRVPDRVREVARRHPEWLAVENRYLSDPEVATLFERAAVCVLPYLHATQSSLPLIAAAFGVPVVASAVGAFLDDVRLVGGLLVPPGDPQALARCIREAMELRPVSPAELEFPNLAERFVAMYRNAIEVAGRT